MIRQLLRSYGTALLLLLLAVLVLAAPAFAFPMIGEHAANSHSLAWLLSGVAVFGATLEQNDVDGLKHLIDIGFLDSIGGRKLGSPVPKTADYQIVLATDKSGTIFTNRGAVGAVTFTLPVITLAMKGLYYEFVGVAAQTFTVAGAAGTVVTFNNAAATSVACSTGGQKIGARIRAYCDGTSWIVEGSTVGVTYTVA